MAKSNRPAILALVEKAWGSAGTAASTEESLGDRPAPSTSGGNSIARQPGTQYGGGRKGPRKPAKPGPVPRRP